MVISLFQLSIVRFHIVTQPPVAVVFMINLAFVNCVLRAVKICEREVKPALDVEVHCPLLIEEEASE
jgi:hypothetical protein